MLRGNFCAKIDEKGRLKIPTAFRALIGEKYGEALYVTSVTGASVRIYPMPVWVAIEEKLAKVPTAHPSRTRFFDRVNYFGQSAEFDKQGRVSIHGRLRESAQMLGMSMFSASTTIWKFGITNVLPGDLTRSPSPMMTHWL